MRQKLFSYGSGDSHIHSHSETYVVGTPAVHTSRPILLLLTSVQSDRNPIQVEKNKLFSMGRVDSESDCAGERNVTNLTNG